MVPLQPGTIPRPGRTSRRDDTGVPDLKSAVAANIGCRTLVIPLKER
jgi:hypothetical protein